ncbi:putative 3'-5' exonuclease [Colletotrichum sublineola]|uniref:Putative 3'-5' exonuclease n=1 Tax=Colletotrichum sublineola TaxID=1173701 RepID=A0A066XH74_COLSU|nr:putative 3'-5' exonuclease [Colletotrichum sublineola]
MAASVLQRSQTTEMTEFPAYSLVDAPEAISDLMDTLYNLPGEVPALYVDLEGENLSREGTISILQIYISPRKHAYIIEIRALGHTAFLTPGHKYNQTLQSVLECSEVTKVFFDVRNDSDALFAHFGIKLDGVQDLQLMEFASRESRKSFLCGLAKCVDRDSPLSPEERQKWGNIKDTGRRLFDPPSGGSYAVFNKRPLPRDILLYCIQDVQYLPQLWLVYNQKLTPDSRLQVIRESQARIKLSQSANFNGQGRHMVLPPAGWAS